jgi:polysaccharide export outer membrane protein
MQRIQGMICLLFLMVGSQVHAQGAAQPALSASASFRLQPGDVVRLAVKDEPDLTGQFPVFSDGTVLLPLIGVVRVSGVDFADVERNVRALYAHELTDAVLVLSPSVRIAVLGEVRVPGLHLLDGTFDLSEAIARAGGLTPVASAQRVMLVRAGRTTRLPVRDSSPFLDGGLLPGDQIVVGRRSWLKENSPLLVGAATSIVAAAITALLVR